MLVMLYLWCLWYLVWYMNNACDICLYGDIHTWKNIENRKYLVSLPCALSLAHDKVSFLGFMCKLCRVPCWHRQRYLKFAVCCVGGTRQSFKTLSCAILAGTLPCAQLRAHGKAILNVVFFLPWTSRAVCYFILPCAGENTWRMFAVCPIKGTRQSLWRHPGRRGSFALDRARQSLYHTLLWLHRVLLAYGK